MTGPTILETLINTAVISIPMLNYSLYKIGLLVMLVASLLLVLKITPFLGYSQVPFAAYGTVLALMVDKPKHLSDFTGCRWIAARFLVSVVGILLTVIFVCSMARWTHNLGPNDTYMFYLPTEIAFISVSTLIVYAACFLFIVMPVSANQLRLEHVAQKVEDHASKDSSQDEFASK